MDQKENALYNILLISSIVLMFSLAFLGYFMMYYYRKRISVEKELHRRNLAKVEAERARVAHDIEHVLQPTLKKLHAHLQTLVIYNDRTSGAIQTSMLLAEHAIEQSNNLCIILSPPRLITEGLGSALHDLSKLFQSIYRVIIVVEYTDIPRLTAEKELHLFRIAEELLQNTAIHAKASQIYLSLTASTEMIRLVVSDDGIGMNLTEIRREKSALGMRAVIAHIEQLEAEIFVENNKGEGTSFVVEIPVR